MDLQGGWEGGREGECLIRGGLQGRQGTEGRAEKLGWKKGTEGSHEIRAQLTNTWGSRTGSRAVGVPARVCNKHPLPHIRGATAPTHGTSEHIRGATAPTHGAAEVRPSTRHALRTTPTRRRLAVGRPRDESAPAGAAAPPTGPASDPPAAPAAAQPSAAAAAATQRGVPNSAGGPEAAAHLRLAVVGGGGTGGCRCAGGTMCVWRCLSVRAAAWPKMCMTARWPFVALPATEWLLWETPRWYSLRSAELAMCGAPWAGVLPGLRR